MVVRVIFIFNNCHHCRGTDVGIARFLSGGFATMAIINPSEKKLAKRTSVQCGALPLPPPRFILLNPGKTEVCKVYGKYFSYFYGFLSIHCIILQCISSKMQINNSQPAILYPCLLQLHSFYTNM